MTIAGLLLAAGRSARFGDGDKLRAMLQGRTLLDHAAQAMRQAPVARRFVVRAAGTDGLDGFETVRTAPGADMSRSLAAGIIAARDRGAEAVLVALADMPFVTAEHLEALVNGYCGPATLLASTDGERRSPPALFGADWFDTLESGTGDMGARPLIARAIRSPAHAGSLRDIDTIEDLAAARPKTSMVIGE